VEKSEQLVSIWDKYENVAMHFNGLLIHLRTQALGAVATVVTAAGFLFTRSPNEPWWAVFAVSLLLLLAWCTLWMIDVCYYSRLLLGCCERSDQDRETERRPTRTEHSSAEAL
jgi:TRAP-type uncharacterized transport system fused permease subunit